MIDPTRLQNIYLNRFANLDDDAQTRILNAIDQGGSVASLYDIERGQTACNVAAPDSHETIWHRPMLPSEADLVGRIAVDALALEPLDFKQAIGSALEDGGRIFVRLEHSGKGMLAILLERDGEVFQLARSKDKGAIFAH